MSNIKTLIDAANAFRVEAHETIQMKLGDHLDECRFQIEVVSARNESEFMEACEYLADNMLATEFAEYDLSVFKDEIKGLRIIDAILCGGGPTVWARYEKDALTLTYYSGSTQVSIKSDDCPLYWAMDEYNEMLDEIE